MTIASLEHREKLFMKVGEDELAMVPAIRCSPGTRFGSLSSKASEQLARAVISTLENGADSRTYSSQNPIQIISVSVEIVLDSERDISIFVETWKNQML